MTSRQDVIDHARTVLALLVDDEWLRMPTDIHPVALAFAERICDFDADYADDLARMVRRTAGHGDVELLEAILRSIDIPHGAPGADSLDHAFNHLAFASVGSPTAAETAAVQAGEAVVVWRRAKGGVCTCTVWSVWCHPCPSCANDPVAILYRAKKHLARKAAETHA